MDAVSRPLLSLPRARLRLRVVGDGPTPVLFVHGWMMTSSVFDGLLPHLDGADRRFILVDQRGAAGSTSTSPDFSLADMVGDLEDTLDALHIDRAVVVGHSMGGQLALALSALHPDRVAAVCAVTPVPLTGFPLPDGLKPLFAAVATDVAAREQVLRMTTLHLDAAALDHLLGLADDVSPACLGGALTAWTGGIAVDAGRITAPVTVVATDDPVLPPALLQSRVVDAIPGARLVHLPGPGHYPQIEAPEALAAVLNEFFRTL